MEKTSKINIMLLFSDVQLDDQCPDFFIILDWNQHSQQIHSAILHLYLLHLVDTVIQNNS